LCRIIFLGSVRELPLLRDNKQTTASSPIQGATGCYKGIGGVLAKMETGVEASSWRWIMDA
jgi:hypothetical protein